MIKTFRHKGLARLWNEDRAGDVPPETRERIQDRLNTLNAAKSLNDLRLPQLRLHKWQGQGGGTWSIDVSGAWRILFRFQDGEACDVDLRQPH
jgi:proteic killer suppression protein